MLWLAGAITLGFIIFVYTTKVLLPGYKNPDSSLYLQSLGYPALLRLLGEPIPITHARPRMETVTDVIVAPGYLEGSSNTVTVSSEVWGTVSEVLVDVGAWVEQGQVLLRMAADSYNIDVQKLKNDLEEKQAALRQASINLSREEGLYRDGAIPLAQLEKLRTEYTDAKTAVLNCKQDLRKAEMIAGSKTRVLSPLSGLVTSRRVNPGEVLRTPGIPLFTIVGQLQFKGFIDEEYISVIKPGAAGQVYLRALSGKPYAAQVTKINPTINTTDQNFLTRTQQPRVFNAWLTLDSADTTLAPGLQGVLEIKIPRQAMVIPSAALIHFSGGEGLVFTVNDDHSVVLRKVTYGRTQNRRTEIISGLDLNDFVVTTAPEGLREGDIVKVTTEPAPKDPRTVGALQDGSANGLASD
jgi:RND family efflux transporter MFP subunit